MTELDPTEEKHLGQVTKAQLVAEPPEHHERENIRLGTGCGSGYRRSAR
jgi:hypothetical protein